MIARTRGKQKNRTREDVTKDQKEVTGRRKGHKEVKKRKDLEDQKGTGEKKRKHWAARKNANGWKCES